MSLPLYFLSLGLYDRAPTCHLGKGTARFFVVPGEIVAWD